MMILEYFPRVHEKVYERTDASALEDVTSCVCVCVCVCVCAKKKNAQVKAPNESDARRASTVSTLVTKIDVVIIRYRVCVVACTQQLVLKYHRTRCSCSVDTTLS